MRGPGFRWWRPVLALVVGAVTTVGLFVVIGVPLAILGVAPTVEELTTPLGSLVGNLTIAAFGIGGLVGVGVGFWRSPWRVLSVAGRMRWRWLLLCHAVVLPIWVLYLAVSWVVFDQQVLPRPEAWVGLVVVSLLTTPLQAAAEEVFFRGALVQTLGAWFRSPVVAFSVTTPVSVAAHGSTDPWIVAELSSLAVLGGWLSWRTGGLEAAIALHVVNNVLVTLSGALLGGLSESYIDAETTGSPVSAAISWVVTLLASALLLRLAQGRGLGPLGGDGAGGGLRGDESGPATRYAAGPSGQGQGSRPPILGERMVHRGRPVTDRSGRGVGQCRGLVPGTPTVSRCCGR